MIKKRKSLSGLISPRAGPLALAAWILSLIPTVAASLPQPGRWGWIYGLAINKYIPFIVDVVGFTDPQIDGKLTLICRKNKGFEAAGRNAIQGKKRPDLLFALPDPRSGKRVEYKLWLARIISIKSILRRLDGINTKVLEIVFFSNAVQKSGQDAEIEVVGFDKAIIKQEDF